MELRLAKRLTPLSDSDKDRLRKLAQLPLQHYKEPDVRKSLLAPIIELLGYEQGKDRDGVREDVQALSPPFVMLGSHKYKFDYKFVVRNQGFWFLEAKSAECSNPTNPSAEVVLTLWDDLRPVQEMLLRMDFRFLGWRTPGPPRVRRNGVETYSILSDGMIRPSAPARNC